MTPATLRNEIETRFGLVHTADHAAKAFGVSRATVFRWMNGDCPIPLWVDRMFELVDTIVQLEAKGGWSFDALPPRWRNTHLTPFASVRASMPL